MANEFTGSWILLRIYHRPPYNLLLPSFRRTTVYYFFTPLAKFSHLLQNVRVCNRVPKTRKPEKKPETENSGRVRTRFHFIKFQVSQVRPEETRKFRVGSGFGYFRVFAHSSCYRINKLETATSIWPPPKQWLSIRGKAKLFQEVTFSSWFLK